MSLGIDAAGAPIMQVRCTCGRRHYDLHEPNVFAQLGNLFGPEATREVAVAVCVCRRCKTRNTLRIPRAAPPKESRRWQCVGCGEFLARYDAPRCRLTSRCRRCGQDVTIHVAEILATA